VNLDEIEQLIKSQFDCLNCAVGGVDDLVYIFITDSVKADAVRKYISEKTVLNVAAFKIVTLDSIPKSDSGKTLYRELEKYYSK
jgi:acyl-coenzyme A synthetase/AMP-(fatty) acid ligase